MREDDIRAIAGETAARVTTLEPLARLVLLAAGVVVRDVRAMPQLQDALRISIGTPAENAQLLAALKQGATR